MFTSQTIKSVLAILSALLISISTLFLDLLPQKPPQEPPETTERSEVHVRERTPEELEAETFIDDWYVEDEDAFYARYFEDYETMAAMDNLSNVLILMTKNPIEDDFGAVFTVTAPYYTFYLQYEDKEQRDHAYEQFLKLKEEGVIFHVSPNYKIVPV